MYALAHEVAQDFHLRLTQGKLAGHGTRQRRGLG